MNLELQIRALFCLQSLKNAVIYDKMINIIAESCTEKTDNNYEKEKDNGTV